MSVFSEISDGLHLVVHSIISMVRGHNPNGSACNFLAIYCVILINMPIRGTIWSFFFAVTETWMHSRVLLQLASSGRCSRSCVPSGLHKSHWVQCLLGAWGKIFQSSEAYLLALFPPSFPKLDATLFRSFICCMLSATKQVNCNCWA